MNNNAHNPVVPFGDTSTKVRSGVDADNFIVNFHNDSGNVTKVEELMETNSPDEPTEMQGSVRDTTRSAYRACKSEAEKHQKTCQTTVPDTSAILDIVGPALANPMPPWYFDLANAMRAHVTMNGGLVPACAVSTISSTDSLNAFMNLHVSYVVTVLRPLMCGVRKFSSHDWVNVFDTIGDNIADICGDRVPCPRQ